MNTFQNVYKSEQFEKGGDEEEDEWGLYKSFIIKYARL